MNYFWFLINNSLVLLICLLLSKSLFARHGLSKQILATALLLPIIILLDIQILGIAGILNCLWITISLAILLSWVWLFYRRSTDTVLKQTPKNLVLQTILLMFLAVAGGLFFSCFFSQGTRFGPDGLSYHSYFAATTVISGDLSLPYSLGNDFYPYNAETLSVWFLLPFQGDGLVCLAGYTWGTISFLLAVVYARRFQASGFWAFLAGGIILLAPPIQAHIRSYAAVDLAGPCMFLASLLFISPSPNAATLRDRWPDFLMGGLCAGYSLGTKFSFLPAVVFLGILYIVFYRKNLFSVLTWQGLLFVTAVFLTGGYWYLRNWLLTGNPFFPAEAGFFSGPLSKDIQFQTTVFYWLFQVPYSEERWRIFWSSLTDWPLPLFVISGCGFLSTACFFVCKRRPSSLQTALFCLGCLLLSLHFFMPFSGSSNSPTAPFRIELRFLIGPYMIGMLLLFNFVNSEKRFGRFWAAAICLAILFRYGFRINKVAVGAGIIILNGILGHCWKIMRYQILAWINRPLCGALIGLGFFAGISFFYPHNQRLTNQQLWGNPDHPGEPYIRTAVWRALEELPPGSSISGFGGIHPWYSYPFFGRRLQFQFVRTNRDGSHMQPLYTMGGRRSGWYNWWDRDSSIPKQETFIENLQISKVNCVVIQADQTGNWPPQRDLLQNCADCTLKFHNEYAEIWLIPDGL